MTSTPCRRDLLLMAAAGVAAAPALALTSTPTLASPVDLQHLRQGLSALDAAMENLTASPPDIERAIRAIEAAMREVETGMHGCGGD